MDIWKLSLYTGSIIHQTAGVHGGSTLLTQYQRDDGSESIFDYQNQREFPILCAYLCLSACRQAFATVAVKILGTEARLLIQPLFFVNRVSACSKIFPILA